MSDKQTHMPISRKFKT